MFPQAVYFPIRTLYLTLKIEQREKHKSAEIALALANKALVRYYFYLQIQENIFIYNSSFFRVKSLLR